MANSGDFDATKQPKFWMPRSSAKEIINKHGPSSMTDSRIRGSSSRGTSMTYMTSRKWLWDPAKGFDDSTVSARTMSRV